MKEEEEEEEGIPLTVISLSVAREPAHSNGCAPLQKKRWTPVL
jgi:hypothetical protein